MIQRAIVYSPEAGQDIQRIDDWITERASAAIAERYLLRVRDWLAGFDIASERGTPYDHLSPGLRIVGFERRLTVAFVVDPKQVTILRIFYAGQDWSSAFDAG